MSRFTHFIRKVFVVQILLSGKFLLFLTLLPSVRTSNAILPGAHNDENNGLSVLVDAETFDYGNPFYDLGVHAGEGFKVAVVHPLDMPIIQQTALNVMPGSFVQIATSINLIKVTSDAMDFAPKERKCWVDSEIELKGLQYSDGYRYSMNNCLYEATIQVAHNNCSCYPGEWIQLNELLSRIHDGEQPLMSGKLSPLFQ